LCNELYGGDTLIQLGYTETHDTILNYHNERLKNPYLFSGFN